MSIEIYKVNNLFTIKRVSVYVFVYGWMCMDGWNVLVQAWIGWCVGWDGLGVDWDRKGSVGWVMVLSLVGLGWVGVKL